MMQKRLADAGDLEQVHEIFTHDTVVPYLGFDPMPKCEFTAVFAGLLNSRAFFVFDRADRVGGFMHVARHPGRSHHAAFISSLAVDPRLHGSGFAHEMLWLVLGELQSQGVRRVELVVETDNPRGIRFYKQAGFEIEGTMRRCYRRAHQEEDIDSHVMGLLL